MMALIKIARCFESGSRRYFWAVYLDRAFITSRWKRSEAMDCAKRLAEITRAEIYTAEIVPFRQGVAG